MLLPVWCNTIYRNKSNQTTLYSFFLCFYRFLPQVISQVTPPEAHQHIPPAPTAAATTGPPSLSLLRCCGGITTKKKSKMRICVTLHHHITARWPHICGKKFPQTSICTSPKAQKWWKNRSVFNFSNTTNMLRVRRGYLQIQAPHKEAHESATKETHGHLPLAETQAMRKRHRSLGKEYFWKAWFPDPLLPSVWAWKNGHCVASYVSVAKVSLQQWQHSESTQTQQQSSRMWLKSSWWSHTEAKTTCFVTQCYLPLISTLLLPSKTKRWDAHTRTTLEDVFCYFQNELLNLLGLVFR